MVEAQESPKQREISRSSSRQKPLLGFVVMFIRPALHHVVSNQHVRRRCIALPPENAPSAC